MALDPKIADRFSKLFAVQLDEQSNHLAETLKGIKYDMSRRGMFHSGVHVGQIFDTHKRELEVRAALAWQALHRAHSSCGSPNYSGLAADLKAELKKSIDAQVGHLNASLSGHASKLTTFHRSPEFDLTRTGRHLVAKHEVEIDIYEDSLMGDNGDSSSSAPQYHFYGNVGAVQTGANASANIIQNLDASEKAALVEALRMARDAVGAPAELEELKRKELVAIADDCITELGSSSPNNTRLLPLFVVLATALQAISSAQPAYLALKTALLPLGIPLP